MSFDLIVLPAQTATRGGVDIGEFLGIGADNPDVIAQFVQGLCDVAFCQKLARARDVGAHGNRPFPGPLGVEQRHNGAVRVDDRTVLAAQRRFTLPHLATLQAGANLKRQSAMGDVIDLEHLLAHQLAAGIARHFQKQVVRF